MKKYSEKEKQSQVEEFIANIDQYSDQEIMAETQEITKYLRSDYKYELEKKVKILSALAIKDLNLKFQFMREYFFTMIDNIPIYDWSSMIAILNSSPDETQEFLLDRFFSKHEFEREQECLPISSCLRYGVELEYYFLRFQTIKELATTNQLLEKIMHSMKIPDDLINQMINHLGFEEKNASIKWILSKEDGNDKFPEISSPIMMNTLTDLNQLKAVCLLFKELGAMTNSFTGLHINIDANYFEGNIEALQNLLTIWGECEELFYKIANEEGEKIRSAAYYSSAPIKDNIQMALEENPTWKLEDQEDDLNFLYSIQVRNRLETILNFEEISLDDTNPVTEKKKYEFFNEMLRNRDINDTATRYTSLNFSHMKWHQEDKGRIEFRLFNSSLSYQTIAENLLLVAKLCEVSLELAKNKSKKQHQFLLLQDHTVNEEEKLDRLLALLFDEKKVREVFKQRWKEIEDNSYYQQYYQRFERGVPTFTSSNEQSHSLSKQL